MVSKKVSFNYRGKKIELTARRCGVFNLGLMFRTRNTKPCLFEFNHPEKFKLTALFVFFPFLVVWLDGDNNVLDIREIKPFTFSISARVSFVRIAEIPLGGNYKYLTEKMRIPDGDRKI